MNCSKVSLSGRRDINLDYIITHHRFEIVTFILNLLNTMHRFLKAKIKIIKSRERV